MDRVFTDKTVIAKKHYRCDASELWNMACFTKAECETEDQILAVEAAEADKWRILPGQAYRKVKGVNDDGFYTYRARIGMDSLCHYFDMFDD